MVWHMRLVTALFVLLFVLLSLGECAPRKKKPARHSGKAITSYFQTTGSAGDSVTLPTLPTAGEGGKGGEECEGVEGGEDGGQPPHARFKDGKCKEKCWCKRDAAAERKRQREKERMRDKRSSMSQEDREKENDKARARKRNKRSGMSQEDRKKENDKARAGMATDENREKDRQRKAAKKAAKKAAEEENAREQSKQQNKGWFEKERGALPPEARNDLDVKAATGEWHAYYTYYCSTDRSLELPPPGTHTIHTT